VADHVGGAPPESLQKPAKEPVERHTAIALDQSALLEVLEVLKVADVVTMTPPRVPITAIQAGSMSVSVVRLASRWLVARRRVVAMMAACRPCAAGSDLVHATLRMSRSSRARYTE
jgi:hypothetical protein